MSKRWVQIIATGIGFIIGGVISVITFTDAKTATGTTIALSIGYALRTWQTWRWGNVEDTESKCNKHFVINWAYFPKEKPNYGDEILLQYPPEQCSSMPKITTIYNRDTELIDGCKWALITPCL
jgi:hypothetical protein